MGKKLRWKILLRDNFKCQNCGFTKHPNPLQVHKNTDLSYLHIDHIKPKILCGTYDEDNLQVLCSACNIYKRSYVFKNELNKKEKEDNE